MRISILSDFHFGFAYNSELENDSFDNAQEAVRKALDSDLILIAGDIFDSRIPKTEVWAKAIRILVKPLMKENTGVRLVHSSKELKEISERTLHHLPILSLHGTHERRGRDETNAIQALDNAGILIHLHCQTIVFEKNGKKIAIHGMSGVPERYAKDVLYQWNPQPIEGCFNILMIHQSIDPFVYSPLEPPSLNLSNLPKGFDMIIDGHIHMSGQQKLGNTTLLFPGSTIVTQMQKNEAGLDKGFYMIDLNREMKIEFVPLKENRKFFYEEVKLDGSSVREQIENKINEILVQQFGKKPLIKLKIFGKENEVLEQELKDLERKYYGQSIISFSKELETPEITKQIEFLRNLREQKFSVEEIGLQVLGRNLEELSFEPIFDYEQAFRVLSENGVENFFNILVGEQATLVNVLNKQVEA